MKVFFDTNIWLRLLLQDIPEQYVLVQKLLSVVDSGKLIPYTSTIVLLEIHFIFKKVYKQPDDEISTILEKICRLRGLTLVEKTNFPLALSYYQKTHVKLADCLIASQLPKNVQLVTFDREFDKITSIPSTTPASILATVNI